MQKNQVPNRGGRIKSGVSSRKKAHRENVAIRLLEKKSVGKPRSHKYNAKAVIINGIRFPSIKEGNRFIELCWLEKAGEITELKRQVRFNLSVNECKICAYDADFTYYNKKGEYVVEDTKGYITPLFKLKMKLMKAIHNIEIAIV